MKELTKIEEILLLAIWKLKSEAYGVKIRKYVSNIINKDFTYGNLYSALGQLERKEYVTKFMGESNKNRRGRPQITYSLTDLGLDALNSAHEMNSAIWEGFTKFAFDRNGER